MFNTQKKKINFPPTHKKIVIMPCLLPLHYIHTHTVTRIASTTKQFDPFIKSAHAFKRSAEAKSAHTHTQVMMRPSSRRFFACVNESTYTTHNYFFKNFFRSTFRVSIRPKLHLSSSRIDRKELFWTLWFTYLLLCKKDSIK